MTRDLRALATFVLLVPALAACSDDDTAAGLPAPDEAEKGEQVDVDAFVDSLEGSFADGTSARVAFDIEGPTQVRGRGVVRYDEDGIDVDVRISDWQVEGGEVLLRTIDGAAYMKVPESRGLWVDIGAADASLADSLLEDADPRDQLERYREEISEVRFGGEETIGGQVARRYQVETELPQTTDAQATGPTIIEFWFDEEGRVIRRSNEVGGGRAQFSWVDWEASVVITSPPARRTITLEDLERLRRAQQERP